MYICSLNECDLQLHVPHSSQNPVVHETCVPAEYVHENLPHILLETNVVIFLSQMHLVKAVKVSLEVSQQWLP